MHSRSNPPTEWRTQEGEDSPCTPSRRAGHPPVTPSNKFVRNPQLAYPSPSTPPRHGKIFGNDSLTPPRNAPITPQRVIHGEYHSSAQSRVIFSGKTRDILAVNSHPVKQELALNHLSTPPTTPIVRSSKPALEYIPVKGMYTSNPTPTSWPSPEPSPSSSRVTRSRQKIGDDRSQSLTGLSPGQPNSTASPALSRGKPSIKLEELEFEDSEIFSIPSSIRAPSTTRSLPRASQTFLPELARPTTRSQTRVVAPLPEVAKEAEQPLFVHNDSLFIFKNGQRLRSFQAIDLHFLIDREQGEKVCGTDEVNDIGYVIAYDMGCGKTAISIAIIVCRPPPKDFKGAKATLVIVPSKGIMDHWVKEAQKFAPQLVVCFYDSYKANMSTNADIVLCTYTQVQRQYDAFAPDPDASPPKAQKPEKYWPLYKHGWFRVIADEAHQFRNPETKTAKAMWAIRKKHGLCLTGTPAQNSFLDYYPLIRFLEVTYEKLNSQVRYESLIYAKKQKGDPTTSARRLLDEIEGSFFIFRKKDDPTEDGKPLVHLPPRRDQYIYVELTYWERIAYQHVKDLPLSIFAKITHLRQACDHPVLVSEIVNSSIFGEEDDEEYNDRCFSFSTRGIFHEEYASSRMLAMLNILTARKKGDKTIIFTHFTRLIRPITRALIHADIEWTEYTGNMSPQARRDALKEIQTDENCTVIIISIKAGGVGLNILACNSVILMDPWWNPYFEEQAIARVHRIGQKKDVEVYHLIVKNSLEEHIMETQKKKRQMIEGGRSDVKFEPKAELDAETMRSWLCETKAEQD